MLFHQLPSDVLLHLANLLPNEELLTLACVSSALRHLLLDSSTIWTTIQLDDYYDLSTAKILLKRSKTASLDVVISSPLFDHVTTHLWSLSPERWRSLSLRALSDLEIADFLRHIQHPLPQLSRLQCLAADLEHLRTDAHKPILASASALRSLKIHGCVACLPPLTALTTLHVSRLSSNYHEFRALLEGLPNLETLILESILEPTDRKDTTYPVFEVPSVSRLAVSFIMDHLPSPSMKPLLTSLRLPNLEYLEISKDRGDYGEFTGKEFPKLATLALRDMSPFCSSNFALLRSLQLKVSRLEVYGVSGLDTLLAEGSWPALTTLVCEPAGDDSSSLPSWFSARANTIIMLPKRPEEDDDAVFYAEGLGGLLQPGQLVESTQWSDLDDDEDSFEDDFDLEFELGYHDEDEDYDDYEEDMDEWD
uniref:F-box domain-containing protein n=1 Tax=Mycena chlorophos TaxID=658473 RepID=A0ABQ0L144_MYCCL|nr:predicted protein [Mycena chlorophos]